jgi:uncharacterized membrane protein HdeD (DUF308 family)
MQQGLPPELAGMLGILITVFCGVLLVAILIFIFFLISMQTALSRVSPQNRKMEPGMVWLALIPCVNIVWQFFIAIQVPDSLKNEFQRRNRDDGSDYGKSLGLAYCIIGLAGAVISNGMSASKDLQMAGYGVSAIASVVQIVVGIMFWIKIVNYSAMLAAEPGDSYGDRRLDAFDDDDGYGGSGKSAGDKSDGIKPGDPY